MASSLIERHWSPALADRLSKVNSDEVRRLVAKSPALWRSMIQELAHDVSQEVRYAVIDTHPHRLEAETLAVSLDDPIPSVIQALASTNWNFAQAQKLLPKLDTEGIADFAKRLSKHVTTRHRLPISETETTELAQLLISDKRPSEKTHAFLSLPLPPQLERFKTPVKEKNIDIKVIAETTPRPEIMQRIINLAKELKYPIPQDLAENPKLSYDIQKQIFDEAIAAPPKKEDDYGDSAIDTLAELMNQAHADSRIVDLAIGEVLKKGL
jgi:hypothetical protein